MVKLVTKWRYLKPDAARHAQAYIRYIATREGVEKYVEENGARPAAQAQRVLVEKLLRDFPDLAWAHINKVGATARLEVAVRLDTP